MRALLLVGLAALATLAGPPVATAAPETTRSLGPGAPPMAQKRYQIGLQLYREGRYAEAAGEFEVGLQLMPDSSILAYNLGRSRERADDLRGAAEAYRRYLALAPRAKDRNEVEAVLAVIDRRLAAEAARLVVRSEPDRARIFLDERPEPWGLTPMRGEVPAGRHDLRVEKAGHAPSRQSFEARAGEETNVLVTLVPLSAEPASRPPEEASSMRPVWGWLGVGLGAAGLGLGAYFGAQALSTRDDAESLRGEPSRHRALEEDYDADVIGLGLSAGLGAALLGTGVYLLLSEPSP